MSWTRRISFLLLLLSLPFALCAEQTDEYTEILQVQGNYRVGFNLLSQTNVGREGLYLLDTIPLLLAEEVEGCPDHTYSTEEALKVREDLIKNRLSSLYSQIETKQDERDEFLFSETSSRKDIKEKEEEIRRLQDEAAYFHSVDPGIIDLVEELPLLIVDNQGESVLFEKKPAMLRVNSESGLELLVYGSLEQFSDYYYMTFRTFNYLTGDDYLLWEGGGEVDEIPGLIAEAARPLRALMLGRPYSELVVDTGLTEGFIYLDGEYQGMGHAEMPYLKPGSYNLEISRPGFQPVVEEIQLVEYETVSVLRELQLKETPLMSLVTYPPGADVYLGSLFVGQTPLNLDLPSQPMLLTLAKEGYDTYKIGVDPSSEEHLVIDLALGEFDANRQFKEEKIKFYRSLGWFALSVGGTLVSWSLSSFYNTKAINASTYDEQQDALDVSNGFYYSYVAFLSLSGAFLGNVFFRLYKMLRAAEVSTWE